MRSVNSLVTKSLLLASLNCSSPTSNMPNPLVDASVDGSLNPLHCNLHSSIRTDAPLLIGPVHVRRFSPPLPGIIRSSNASYYFTTSILRPLNPDSPISSVTSGTLIALGGENANGTCIPLRDIGMENHIVSGTILEFGPHETLLQATYDMGTLGRPSFRYLGKFQFESPTSLLVIDVRDARSVSLIIATSIDYSRGIRYDLAPGISILGLGRTVLNINNREQEFEVFDIAVAGISNRFLVRSGREDGRILLSPDGSTAYAFKVDHNIGRPSEVEVYRISNQ